MDQASGNVSLVITLSFTILGLVTGDQRSVCPESVVRGLPTGWDHIWKPIVTALAHAGVESGKGSRRQSLLNWTPKVEQEVAGQEKRQREEHGHRQMDRWICGWMKCGLSWHRETAGQPGK